MTTSLDGSSPRRLLAALLAALLLTSCGGGGEQPANTQAATAQGGEAVASKVAAGGREQALATDAAPTAQALSVGGDRIRQVIVFGDSLSDVGTYKVGPIAEVGGGKFTTNPGPVWAETIGLLFGAPVTPFRQGFGGVSQIVGGTGFAMGGARVSQQPGLGCDPDPQTGACTAALTIPVTQQISDYLGANGDRFTRNQLVFVFAGGNELFFQFDEFAAKLQRGVPFAQAQAELQAAVAQAAGELAGQVRLIIHKGATRVAVLTVPDIADTIFGRAAEQAPVRPLIAAMVQLFNGTLAAGLTGSDAKLIDTYAQFKRVIENPGRFHVTELNVAACDAAKIAAITGGQVRSGSSLFCSLRTLVQNDAPLRYFFADDVHPTTLGHLIIARFVLTEMWRQRLL